MAQRLLSLHLFLVLRNQHRIDPCAGGRRDRNSFPCCTCCHLDSGSTNITVLWPSISQTHYSHFSSLQTTASCKWLSAVIKANWSANYSPASVIGLPVPMSHQVTEKRDVHKSHRSLGLWQGIFSRGTAALFLPQLRRSPWAGCLCVCTAELTPQQRPGSHMPLKCSLRPSVLYLHAYSGECFSWFLWW